MAHVPVATVKVKSNTTPATVPATRKKTAGNKHTAFTNRNEPVTAKNGRKSFSDIIGRITKSVIKSSEVHDLIPSVTKNIKIRNVVAENSPEKNPENHSDRMPSVSRNKETSLKLNPRKLQRKLMAHVKDVSDTVVKTESGSDSSDNTHPGGKSTDQKNVKSSRIEKRLGTSGNHSHTEPIEVKTVDLNNASFQVEKRSVILRNHSKIKSDSAETVDQDTPASRTAAHSVMLKRHLQNKSGLAETVSLSSHSSRVEVVDNRSQSPESVFEKPGRAGVRKKNHGVNPLSDQKQGIEPVKLTHNSIIGDLDIEISTRTEGGNLRKSAAAELARKLDAQAGNEIVRQVKVILDQANAGEVRINLRPDNLGQIRIRIRMEDNRLTGRIFVESAAVRAAFRSTLEGLQTRLVESGFGSADLEMAWDDSSERNMRNGNQSRSRQDNLNEALKEFDNIIPTYSDMESADSRVNMII